MERGTTYSVFITGPSHSTPPTIHLEGHRVAHRLARLKKKFAFENW